MRYIVTYVVKKEGDAEVEVKWVNDYGLLKALTLNLIERIKLGTVKKVLIEVLE